MSDIMERLRGLADLFEAGDAPRHVVLHMRAGADEIKRLRERTEYWPDNAERDAVIRHQKEEIERLRAALERIADTDPDDGTAWFHSVARAALEGE